MPCKWRWLPFTHAVRRKSCRNFFEIREPKRRLIAAAPFRDRVVHHALCNVVAPLLERRFIARSFSCQVGKGTTAARECCRRLTNRHRYVLKCDVSKFFPNIDHAILLGKLSRRIRCPGVLGLVRLILDGYCTGATVPAPLFLERRAPRLRRRKPVRCTAGMALLRLCQEASLIRALVPHWKRMKAEG
ncbi:MAG: hypothetical protein HY360_27135 [Verrucomicrobia bacterium]|nr:hypothetical protein [Verrucomicrobiota bacterium]